MMVSTRSSGTGGCRG